MTDSLSERLTLGDGPRLASGEQNIWAWTQYLAAIRRRVPEVLDELVQISSAATRDQKGLLDPATDVALARWSLHWGFPWIPMARALWWIRQLRANVLTWQGDPSSVGQWILFDTGTTPEPAGTPPGNAGWTLRWLADGSCQIVWPSIEWHPTDEPEEGFRQRVNTYIAMMKALRGTAKTPATYRPIDFDALVLEHVVRLPIEQVHERLGEDGSLVYEDRSQSATLKRNGQLADLLGLLLRRAVGRPQEIRKMTP